MSNFSRFRTTAILCLEGLLFVWKSLVLGVALYSTDSTALVGHEYRDVLRCARPQPITVLFEGQAKIVVSRNESSAITHTDTHTHTPEAIHLPTHWASDENFQTC